MFDQKLKQVSPISGRFAHTGTAVNVCIYRLDGDSSPTPWTLQVTSEDRKATMWMEGFPSDQEAFKTFYLTAEKYGVAGFFDKDSAPLLGSGSSSEIA
ncbi:MAG: hypothetical protein AAAC48_15555 [Phyllobacterium sp.]|jgi:hypothetical protein|uniref:hypothetical protein n=1 Tax=Phyllobacterium sp. TaxID=1871046 RepID=UPI0030F28D6F